MQDKKSKKQTSDATPEPNSSMDKFDKAMHKIVIVPKLKSKKSKP